MLYIVMRYMAEKSATASTSKDDLSKRDYEFLAAFRYSLRKFLRFSENAAEEKGLTVQQHQALLSIKGFPGRETVTVGELAERLQIKHHSAVGLVDRLAEQKLIKRTASSEDRRQVWISLTTDGLQLLRDLSLVHRDELRRLSPKLRSLLQQLD